jgi:pyrroline-5-carboxylate reductase
LVDCTENQLNTNSYKNIHIFDKSSEKSKRMSETGPPPEQSTSPAEEKAPETAQSGTSMPTPSPTSSSTPTTSSSSSPKKKSSRKGKVELSDAKIGFVGAGKIADSIIRGLMTYAKIDANRIFVAAKSTRNLEALKEKGCHVTKRNYDIFAKYDCDIVFLCFHGSVIKQCYKIGGSRPHPFTTNFIPNQKHPLYVLSLVSGVSLDQIRGCLLNPEHPEKYMLEMHRIMLNTAVAYGLGLGAVDVEPDGKKCSPIIRDLLTSFSKLEYIPETEMDSACALGGNGLAFAYYYIGALADGAFKMGLSRQIAIKFAAKTAQCAALTLLESGKHPSELKDSCTSPSGAAIYGIHVLDKADVASGIVAAVEAAHKRAKEMAENEVD